MITLTQANAIIAAAFGEGARQGFDPLCVAVLDPGGHLLALQRQDGATTLRVEIARAKAAGAISLGRSSRRIGDVSTHLPVFFTSLMMIAPQGLVTAAGGVVAVDDGGRIVGGVGVSGDTSDNDELCAIAGLKAQGFAVLP